MDVLDYIQRNGLEEVSNPAYNPKSKNNIESPTIKVPQLTPTNSSAVNMAIIDFNNQYSIDAKENEKYRKYGLNYSPYDNMDIELANAQGTLTKWGNSLAQTLVSELGLGTLKAGSDLIDWIGQAVGISSPDYTNPVSQFLEEKQEEFRNFAPIYTDPNKSILNGGLTDAGWWASNMPSIVSSLTLFVPGMAVTTAAKAVGVGKGISKLRRSVKAIDNAYNKIQEAEKLRAAGATAEEIAKAGKLSNIEKLITSPKIISGANTIAETTVTGALNRAMENYQEARQTYSDVYLQASETFKNMSDEDYQNVLDKNSNILEKYKIDGSNRDELAKAIAKEGADTTFKIDWLNVGFDIIQLYALRGLFTSKGLSKEVSSSVRRANLDFEKYPGKTAEQIAAIKKARPFKEKAAEWIGDKAYGSKLVVGAELSEGVEEAVNYIAQQEGIHLGKYLTNETDEEHSTDYWTNVLSGFDGRISDYVKAPQLWDSAFWGVLGGVVFQGLGSKAKQIQQKLSNKSDLTKEEKEQAPWYKFDELPENKAKITEIQNRPILYQQYKAQLDRINKGVDIYNSTKDGEVKFEGDVEAQKDVARKRLMKEYSSQLAIQSLQTGTFDMLTASFANDNVRKAMVENGMFNEEGKTKTQAELEQESKQFVKEVLDNMHKTEEIYNQELVATDRLVGVVNSKSATALPPEYIQMIATKNTNALLAIESLNPAIDAASQSISDELNRLSSQNLIDGSIDYRQNVRMELYADQLGRLRLERKRLTSGETNLSNRIAIRNIDKQIDYIEKLLKNEFNQAQITYITNQSLRYMTDSNGEIKLGNTPESFEYIDSLITNRSMIGGTVDFDMLLPESKISSDTSITLDDAQIGEFRTIEQDIKRTFDDLKKVSPNLQNQISNLESLVLTKNSLINSLINDTDKVGEYATEVSNTLNEARKKAINDAYKNLRDIRKNKRDEVEEAIDLLARGKSLDSITNLTDNEKQTIKDSVDVLALHKAKNANVLDSIYEAFKLEDDIEIAQQNRQNRQNNNQLQPQQNPLSNPPQQPTPAPAPQGNTNTPSNSNQQENSSQNGSQSTQAQQPANSPTQPLNGNTSNPSGQNGQSQPNIDPQNIQNRNASFSQSGNAINGVNVPNASRSDVAFYDNGDGTFTIDTGNESKYYAESALYDNADSVDLLRPIRVTSFPIVQRQSNGSYDVVEKGDFEYADSASQGTQAAQPSSSSSTGELGQTNQAAPNSPIAAPSAPSAPNIQDDGLSGIRLDSLQELSRSAFKDLAVIFNSFDIRNNPNVNLDELETALNDGITKLINDAIANGIDERDAESTIRKASSIMFRKINSLRNNSAPTMASSVDEVLITQSSLSNNFNPKDNNDVVTAYKQALYQMLNQYAAEQGLQKFNGKLYINIEDLFRYINQISNDTTTASSIFEALKKQLDTDEAKQKFAIIDENEVNKTSFWDNVNKSREERLAERERDAQEFSLDISKIFENAHTDEETNSIYEALERLRIGDELGIEVERSKNTIWFTDKDGNRVGSMVIPSIDSKTGGYQMTNDGWSYDILPSNNGSFTSKLYDFFLNLFEAKDKDSQELLSIIYESAFTKPNQQRKAELLNQFKHNSVIIGAKHAGLTGISVTDNQLANGLVKLVRFIGSIEGADMFTRGSGITRKSSLRQWFKKITSSYDMAQSIANSPSGTYNITVKGILLGSINRVEERVNPNNISNLPTPNEALVDGVNLEQNKIAITYPGDKTKLLVAGAPTQSFNVNSDANTFVTVPNINGGIEFVQAYPVNVLDDSLGKEAKEIVKAIRNEAARLFDEYSKYSSIANRQAIEDFFRKLVHVGDSNSTLFRNVFIKSQNWGISISAQGEGNVIHLFNRPRVGEDGILVGIGNNQTIGINSKEFKDRLNNILDNLKFQFSYAYFASDNNTSTPLRGIANRENGKFVITIGQQKWEFDSFNNFVLNQNIVRINTKPNAAGTSNFNRTFRSGNAYSQSFKVDITSTASSPVGEMNAASAPTIANPNINATSVNDRVKSILESNSSNKGNEIIESLVGTDSIFDNNAVKAFKNLGLLPENIIFDEHFNDNGNNDNARVYLKSNKVVVGTKWISKFNNPLTRRQAIRILIHEQLHIKLNGKQGRNAINSIQSIYDDFKKALEDDAVKAKLSAANLDVEHLKAYLFEGNENALEEFLVESITSEELAIALNTIDTRNPRTGRVSNLFQKILKFLSDLFGWDVRKGSLYEEELYTIRTTMSKVNNESSASSEETTSSSTSSTGELGQSNETSQTPAPAQPSQPIDTQERPSVQPVQQPELRNGTLNRANRDRRFRRSSVDEQLNSSVDEYTISAPTVQSFTERLPLAQQAKFSNMVARGEVSTSCR